MEGANNLAEAIQEDTDDGTTHRIKQCLRDIGIRPIFNDKKIRLAMEASMGDNLAFLFTLRQMNFPRDPNQKGKIGKMNSFKTPCNI